jgi:hypothetical protein
MKENDCKNVFKHLFYCKDEDEAGDCPEPLLNRESVIGGKITGSCRRRDCFPIKIKLPKGAAAAEVKGFALKKILVKSKKPHAVKKGFWEIRLHYVFEFNLVFYDGEGRVLTHAHKTNAFNQSVTLHGSRCPAYATAAEGFTFPSRQFTWVQAKALPLGRLTCKREDTIKGVFTVWVGLFSVISLFRFAHMFLVTEGSPA